MLNYGSNVFTNLLFSLPWKSNGVFFQGVLRYDLREISKILHEKTLKAILKATLY